ncbi:MAG: hypothetical protein ACK46Y_13065 [Fluviicola sp.]
MKIISRQSITSKFQMIQFEISHIQNLLFENESDESFFENETDSKEYLDQFDCLEYKNEYSIYKNEYILSIKTNSTDEIELTYLNSISQLLKTKNCSELIWIAHLKNNLFGSNEIENDKLKLAFNSIQEKLETDFNDETLIFSTSEIKNIIPFLYLSARFDASAPEFSFLFDKNEQFQFHFCNLGNIHFTEYKAPFLSKIELEQMGFTVLEKC